MNWKLKLLPRNVLNYKHFADDAVGWVQNNKTVYVLHGVYKNIQFTYEFEKENKLSFLDALMTRTRNKIEKTV